MPVSVTMPRLGESVTEGTVTRWLKQEGDHVEADEPLLEVSTDKVDTEIPSPAAGVLTRIVVQEDETAEVGAELAVIGGDSGDAAPAAEEPAAEESAAEEPAAEEEPAAVEPEQEPSEEVEEPAAAAESSDSSGSSGESTSVKMPALGESVTEGTVTRWLKQVGDSVEADEPLLEVSTDKVDTEIPSPVAGTLLEIKVPEDETVEVGAELAVIGAAGAGSAPKAEAPKAEAPKAAAPAPKAEEKKPEPKAAAPEPKAAAPEPKAAAPEPKAAAPEPKAAAPEPQPATAAPVQAGPATNVTAPAGGNGKVEGDDVAYVTPLVRKLATEHGVNLSSLTGTGVGGRIRKQDVLDAAAKAKEAAAAPAAAPAAAAPAAAGGSSAPAPKAAPSPLRGQTVKLTRMRALIARRMVESLQISAQLTTVVEVDVTKVAKLREQAKAQFLATHGVKLSFLPFFALAAVEALRVHPSVNSSIDLEAGTVKYHDAEHLGMAVDSDKGLIVPVIKNAGDLNLAGLAKRIADVADRTRNNKLSPDDIAGGTFTLTNTGSRGALFDTPIINQPQVAILGTGAVVKRAVVVSDPELGEVIAPRSMVYLALSYDHRIVDGADAARFLSTVKERLEAGHFEADLGL
ncbi:2-oxoglutarate dehydrogenase, E2 component, dihydrolipoamide succinyltransferase [Dactylosporangium vinaceum]|uniref:Dihydrolipoamide acetyltransferase component of pyruvate dehydrogenase complex n=1 Tax=Dactylosporangium vinaceum TaxID=53362 RepID=A0ABV5MNL7_9ACTN|nr:2-oxoglutarate dehydrogenase, E2 component, dihydrolipoamide succinyltransferase [Dactylosporangium vinaceum]UAB95114.1 2-oxoglutarate dehydrogenase, E2 component, dihydrolipoamide succinyltransferase [Dactylosporangium vinaceum]